MHSRALEDQLLNLRVGKREKKKPNAVPSGAICILNMLRYISRVCNDEITFSFLSQLPRIFLLFINQAFRSVSSSSYKRKAVLHTYVNAHSPTYASSFDLSKGEND